MSEKERTEQLASHIRSIIELLGEDPDREGLAKTPMRAAKALEYITSGYNEDAKEILQSAMFDHLGSKIVTVRDIEFYSMCEHHILPFFGKVSIAYLPTTKIVGLSKLARIVNTFARRLQVQEHLTAEICTAVNEALETDGVLVKCVAEHLCMKMRGVEKQDASTETIEYCGKFADDPSLLSRVITMLS